MAYRPSGVVAIAVMFIISSVLCLIGIVFLETVTVAGEYRSAYLSLFVSLAFFQVSPSPPGLWIEPLVSMFSYLSEINIYHLVAAIIFIFSLCYLFAGVGLLQMKHWGYYMALIMALMNIILSAFAVLAGGSSLGLVLGVVTPIWGSRFGLVSGIVPLIFGIIVFVYLLGDVKYEFE
ncbi:MAG: hypothetical protein KIH08_02230 [Candidatus Freyarchaeota archaeon]|nr:hypothetical protein [Candidatus Jordarchaeia archaeon]MBS7268455.1 hypothetical protein [Candidatus Jordarchaeia archaeon]